MKKIGFLLFNIYVIHLYKTVSSGKEDYSLYSTLKFSSSELTIEKNTFDDNSFFLLTESPSSFNTSTESSEMSFNSDSNNTETFTNMSHVYINVTERISKITVSVIEGNCEFPLIFGSQNLPKFIMNGDYWKLEIMDDFSDFSDNYGTSKSVSDSSYSTSKAGSDYKYLNILCPFYNKVKLFFKLKI
jgi:hypothetical protein